MQTFLEPSSYPLANKRWVPRYSIFMQSGHLRNDQPIKIENKYFDIKEEADRFINNLCIKKGYIPVKEK